MNMDGVERLCKAIILSVVDDYRDALKARDIYKMQTAEKFFRSGWFQLMTDVDGEYLISKIRKEYMK